MGGLLQRLFSTFAGGWPGLGLLIQRLATGIALFHNGMAQLEAPTSGLMVPEMTGAALALFIVTGLWTPVAGAFVAVVEVWIALSGASDAWVATILAVLGGTLAMIGPGAWSIDARLFGRKHIGG
jgi:putative oxidoreductase